MGRAYYQNDISDFIQDDQQRILGELTQHHFPFDLSVAQRNAWIRQTIILQEQLRSHHHGQIFFEFSIPRMGKRADVILLIKNIIFVLEFKTDALTYERYQADQAFDYALDLKNFHLGSHKKYIIPILICTAAPSRQNKITWYEDNVSFPLYSNGTDLNDLINQGIAAVLLDKQKFVESAYGFGETSQEPFENEEWSESGYRPTPTIIEAAQALYQNHSVKEISRSDAGAINLTSTTDYINSIIQNSKRNNRKSICFVTGVPGAGKTLAGLNIAAQSQNKNAEERAVFLSGNGPLVDILREALARDRATRSKETANRISIATARREVTKIIQNIHHFRDDGLNSSTPPDEHVVIFDEAQRAWNKEKASQFLREQGYDLEVSEPEFLISYMDRRKDWCTVICLIGGGQEINTGEAGLVEWFNALQNKFNGWDVYHSGQLLDKNYNWGQNLENKLQSLNTTTHDALHLSVSIRSFRAEKLSEFVGAIIEGDSGAAFSTHKHLDKYDIRLTRNIHDAREWLRSKARGTERLGLVAYSGAIRLKPEGINVKAEIDAVNWFLNGKEDIRSSYYLEDVATEFDVQGLELDWVGVCWDANLRATDEGWSFHNFRGTKWESVNDAYRRVYLANAYRVLLTRARQGMIIFIPKGDERDPTRPPGFYDSTYEFLKKCGVKEL